MTTATGPRAWVITWEPEPPDTSPPRVLTVIHANTGFDKVEKIVSKLWQMQALTAEEQLELLRPGVESPYVAERAGDEVVCGPSSVVVARQAENVRPSTADRSVSGLEWDVIQRKPRRRHLS